MTQTTAALSTKVRGAKISKIDPLTPVFITRLRTVGIDKQTIEMQLEQQFPAPMGGTNPILGFFMEGHSAFNSGPRKRIAWQNISTDKAIKMGIIRTWDEVSTSTIEVDGAPIMQGAMLVKQELKVPNSKGGFVPLKLVEIDSYTPRKWNDARTGAPMAQRPKQAGPDGDVLTNAGEPIYRNTALSMEGADDAANERPWDHDLIIVHDNTVVGSSVREALGKANIAMPQTPGAPAGTRAINEAQGTSSSADLNLQNKGIGETSNLKEGAPESTRHTPGEASPNVAEKTLAEQQREAGTRPARV